MEIICLASSSSGNAYVIRNEKDSILVEAGIDFKLLKQRLLKIPLVLTNITAVAITHSHGDHCRCASNLSQFMPVIASKETLDACNIYRNRWAVSEWERVPINSFTIAPFELDHDCDGTFGFIIIDKFNKEKLLFINDTKLVKYDFSGSVFDYVMIECNHNDEILDRADARTQRTALSHMSLATTKTTLSKMNLSQTKAIYLMHLSDGNADEERMKKEVMELTGLPTYICQKEGGFK